MTLSPLALQQAAGALRQISDSDPGERGRRAAVVALVLRTIERLLHDPEGGEFLLRRTEAQVDAIASRAERSYLRRVMVRVLEENLKGVGALFAEYATALEEARRFPEARAVIELARSLEPERSDLALMAGRLARLDGDRTAALALYGVARNLDRGDGSMARLARIGEAVVDATPVEALGAAIREAVLAGDQEAAAVGLEERGMLRRHRGDRAGAVRDFAIAVARYRSAVDRGRVGHLMADLFVASNDPEAAREALLFTLATGDRTQRDHARARLHTVSRDLGDQIGMRRWRSFEPQRLVSLSARLPDRAQSLSPLVYRWRTRFESATASKP